LAAGFAGGLAAGAGAGAVAGAGAGAVDLEDTTLGADNCFWTGAGADALAAEEEEAAVAAAVPVPVFSDAFADAFIISSMHTLSVARSGVAHTSMTLPILNLHAMESYFNPSRLLIFLRSVSL
jgi:hypothetical protein